MYNVWAINYVKEGKIIQWGKDSFIYKWWWESQKATCKRIKFDYSLEPYTKINLKCADIQLHVMW